MHLLHKVNNIMNLTFGFKMMIYDKNDREIYQRLFIRRKSQRQKDNYDLSKLCGILKNGAGLSTQKIFIHK